MASQPRFFQRPLAFQAGQEQPAASLAVAQSPAGVTPSQVGNAQVNPMPAATSEGSGLLGVIGSPLRLLGRGLGSNKITLDANGNATVAHPMVDALLNGGKANDTALQMSFQKAQQDKAQADYLARLAASTGSEKDIIAAKAAADQATHSAAAHDSIKQLAATQAANTASAAGRTMANPDGVQLTPSQLTATGTSGSESIGETNAQKAGGLQGDILSNPQFAKAATLGQTYGAAAPYLEQNQMELPQGGTGFKYDPFSGITLKGSGQAGFPTTTAEKISTGQGMQNGQIIPARDVERTTSGAGQGAGITAAIPVDQDAANAIRAKAAAAAQVNPMPDNNIQDADALPDNQQQVIPSTVNPVPTGIAAINGGVNPYAQLINKLLTPVRQAQPIVNTLDSSPAY